MTPNLEAIAAELPPSLLPALLDKPLCHYAPSIYYCFLTDEIIRRPQLTHITKLEPVYSIPHDAFCEQ